MYASTVPVNQQHLPPDTTDPHYVPQPGRLGNLTHVQQEALDTLRRQLQEEGAFVPERMNDAMLLRCAPLLLVSSPLCYVVTTCVG